MFPILYTRYDITGRQTRADGGETLLSSNIVCDMYDRVNQLPCYVALRPSEVITSKLSIVSLR